MQDVTLKRDRMFQSRASNASPECVAFVVRHRAHKKIKQSDPMTFAEAIDLRDFYREAGLELDHQPRIGVFEGIGPALGYETPTRPTRESGKADPLWWQRDRVLELAAQTRTARRFGRPEGPFYVEAFNIIQTVPEPRRQEVWDLFTKCANEGKVSA